MADIGKEPDAEKGGCMTDNALAVFENYTIRCHYNEETETWYFSVIDIMQVLLQQPDYQAARKYWNKLKERLKYEGSQTVTNCHQFKMKANAGFLIKEKVGTLSFYSNRPLFEIFAGKGGQEAS